MKDSCIKRCEFLLSHNIPSKLQIKLRFMWKYLKVAFVWKSFLFFLTGMAYRLSNSSRQVLDCYDSWLHFLLPIFRLRFIHCQIFVPPLCIILYFNFPARINLKILSDFYRDSCILLRTLISTSNPNQIVQVGDQLAKVVKKKVSTFSPQILVVSDFRFLIISNCGVIKK